MMGTLDELRLFSESYFTNKKCGQNPHETSQLRTTKETVTNFSIDAILKPGFGHRFHDSEDDCESSLSQSSGETYVPNEVPFLKQYPTNVSKMLLMRFIEQSQRMCSSNDESPDYSKSPSPAPSCTASTMSITSSSQISSDSESALDLRIRRKKTPPAQQVSAIPAWVFCTRYSDRPSAGPRARKRRHIKTAVSNSKRPRTAFNSTQLQQLQTEFEVCAYLSEERRNQVATKLDLDESQVKIWFQNRRAKVKKITVPRPLALKLKEEGLYNHKPLSESESASCQSDVGLSV